MRFFVGSVFLLAVCALPTAVISGCNFSAPVDLTGEILERPEIAGPDAEVSRILCRRAAAPAPEYCASFSGSVQVNNLVQYIEACGITTPDQLIAALPESYRKSYTLMYYSESLQHASPEYPRAILFGQNAQTLMTFNGSPEQFGYNAIEIIEWNEPTHEFVPYNLEFGPAPRTGEDNCAASGQTSLNVRFSTRPAVCYGCHGGTEAGNIGFRPNWGGYNIWIGSYGSVSRNGVDGMHSHQFEARSYENFLKTNKNTGRYQYLPTTHPDIESIYAPEEPARVSFTANGNTEDEGGYDANPTLTNQLMILNHRRIARMFVLHPHFDKFKYVLTALGAGCIDLCSEANSEVCENNYPFFGAESLKLSDFYPPVFNENFRSFAAIYDDVMNTGIEQRDARYDMLAGVNEPWLITPNYFFRSFANTRGTADVISEPQRAIAAILMIAERAFVPSNNWSLDFTDGTYNLFGPREKAKDIFPRILRAITDLADPDLPVFEEWTATYNPNGATRYDSFEQCRELKTKSLQAFSTR